MYGGSYVVNFFKQKVVSQKAKNRQIFKRTFQFKAVGAFPHVTRVPTAGLPTQIRFLVDLRV